MSVQVRRRREAAAFLSNFVGAQGELLVDTTNNRVQVHDGVTPGGWPAAKLSEVLTSSRTPVADANYVALAGDRTIAFTTLTASRVVTLPAAASYPPGAQLVVVDEAGTCSAVITITVARAGTDTINGAANAVLALPYGFLAFLSNGLGKWTIVDQSTASLALQSAASVAISGGAGAFASLSLGGNAVATTPQLNNRNTGINTNFAINQRAYASSTALTAGSYGHDRVKAGSNGCTYTFTQSVPDTIVTITAGTLVQAIDAANIYATSYWLTWTGTSFARVWQGSSPGTFVAGTPMTIDGVTVNALLVTGLAIGTTTNVEFSTGSLGTTRPWQFEASIVGAGPTRFERRHLGQDLALCQRYYQFLPQWVGIFNTSSIATLAGSYNVTMRAVPTIIIVNGSNALATPGVNTYNVTSIGGPTNMGNNGGYMTVGTAAAQAGSVALMFIPSTIALSAEL